MFHTSWTEWKNLFSLEIFCRSAKLQVDGLAGSYGPQRLTVYAMRPELGPPDVETIEYPGGRRVLEPRMAAVRGCDPRVPTDVRSPATWSRLPTAGGASKRRTHASMRSERPAVPPQIVVLAGGLGSRMEAVAEGLPKSLIPVRGEPFVHHQLRLLASQGIRDVVYVIGFRGEQIRRAVGDGAQFGLAVSYVDEGNRLRGTGGALRFAYDTGSLEEVFGVLYGDAYLPIDLDPVWAAFDLSDCPALMTVLRNEDRWDTSNAVFAEGRVTNYDKRIDHRAAEMRWIDYGLSVLRREVVESMPNGRTVRDLGEVFHELSMRGELAGFEVGTRFFEVGSLEGVAALESYLARGSG